MSASDEQAADVKTEPGSDKKSKPKDDEFDWNFDHDEKNKEDKTVAFQKLYRPIRSAFLIHLIQNGLPQEQRGIFYFLMIQFHEDLDSPLLVYSALPALLMGYYPKVHPLLVYSATRGIDGYRRMKHKGIWEVLMPPFIYSISSYLFATLFDFRGMTEVFELIFGPASKWPAALLPIFPGMFLRFVNERPNSINGFVPENKQGIWIAVFARACTAVLPTAVRWPIWAAYTAPSVEYPVMFIDWLVCSFCWSSSETSMLGAYAIWLLVNQYRHTSSWFRNFGGGPSVVLERERRGTLWYIAAIILIQLIEVEIGPSVVENESMTLRPEVWIPFALLLVTGVYLLKYGVMLRIYKYNHKPLKEGPNIRLLRLRAQPRWPNAPIQCDIIYTSLRCPPQYTAVSHRWDLFGAPQEMILIDGGLFPVSRSIYSLLLAKRHYLHPRYFWIDSICINQEDNLEKSRQVGMMRNIYEEAENTLGWLGDDPGAKKAFALVGRINKTISAASFTSLCSEPDSGWTEFQALMSNDWFDRVWIIQEIAVSKAQIIRYGDQEIEWSELTDALAHVMHFGFSIENDLDELLNRREVLSALVMEEVRSHIAKVDLVKLQDTLKLALRFRATLSIDRIYALLGLVAERYTPLFHPSFGMSADIGSKDPRMALKDTVETMELLSEIIGTATGRSNSRRGRAILSSGTENALRHTLLLMSNMKNLTNKIEKMGKGSFDEEPIRPDYSGKATAQLVYTHVTRDIVQKGDALSFIRYAGISIPPSQALDGLPSWVPDWSTDAQVYILPWRKYTPPIIDEIGDKPPAQRTPIFQDGGPKFLFVKGLIVGTITHSTPLTQDYDSTQYADDEEAQTEKDFLQLSSNFQAAFELAKEHVRPQFQTETALQEAFHRVLIADSIPDGDPTASSMRTRIPGSPITPPILAAKNFKEHISNLPSSGNSGPVQRHQSTVFKKYLSTRRIQSSENSKFAHLVRADVVPSFDQYRQKSKDSKDSSPFSILKRESAGSLAGYAQYVDYTIGRAFVVTDKGLMGLACSGSEVGDVVVRIESDRRVVWLTLREQEFEGEAVVEDGSKGLSESERSAPEYDRTYRLVGEAYIHDSHSRHGSVEDLKWFRLW